MGETTCSTMNLFSRAIATIFMASAIHWQVATSQMACDSGCGSVNQRDLNDGFCDCDDCSDESSWTCSLCGGCPSCSSVGSYYSHCSSRRRQSSSSSSSGGGSAPTVTASFDWSLTKSYDTVLVDTTVTVINRYGVTTEDQQSTSTEMGIGSRWFGALVGGATSSVTTAFTFYERTETISLQAGDAGFCRWQLVASVSGSNCAGSSYTASDQIPFDVFKDSTPPCSNSKPSVSYADGHNDGTISMCGAATPTPTPTPTATGGKDSCFPGDSLATLQNGDSIRMDQLKIHHHVKVAPGKFEPVITFGRAHEPDETLDVIVIHTAEHQRTLRLSGEHFIWLKQKTAVEWEWKRASGLTKGDMVLVVNPDEFMVEDRVLSIVKEVKQGMFSPVTPSGQIVVDAVLVSAYSTPTLSHESMHLLMAPFRMIYAIAPSLFDLVDHKKVGRMLHHGLHAFHIMTGATP